MIVVAGPPGSGKSSAFPVSRFGSLFFNADDRAAELNGGSYVGIPTHVRHLINREFEAFIHGCIAERKSFAIETTLRSGVTFEQARKAKASGFSVEMRYLALQDFAMHLERIKARADAGGHSAPESVLRHIYECSLSNLPQAIAEMDELWIYENSMVGGPPMLLAETHSGDLLFVVDDPPPWLRTALDRT